jgi:hypothetical protein
MQIKPRPNHRRYLDVLRRMTSEQKAQKAFELSEFTKQLFLDSLRERHPGLSQRELHRLALNRLVRCRNRSF